MTAVVLACVPVFLRDRRLSRLNGGLFVLTYLGYRFLLRRGYRSGIGFAAGTTAGNAIATPAIIGLADPRFQPYVETATAQVAASVLVTAILAPLLASAVLKKEGGLLAEEEIERIDEMKLEDFDVDLSGVELPQKPEGERLTTQELDSAVESFLSALQER